MSTSPTGAPPIPAARWWSGPLWFGGGLQALGIVIATAELTTNWRGVVAGMIIAWVGFLIFLPGIIGFALQAHGIAATAQNWAPTAAETVPDSDSPPAQMDPAQDPRPFVPHQGDSALIIEVRRACLSGATRRAVRRLVDKADRIEPVSQDDRDLVDALIAAAERRPIQSTYR